MTAPSPGEGKEGDLVTRLSLLVGQGFFFGLMVGLVVISAFALLMSAYGAGALPWVYIVVAILGSLAFYGFAEAQRRWSLVQVSLVTEAVVVAFLATAWAGLAFAQAKWLAFAAMVVYSLLLQIGFVILGGQAGKLLDVRQIKRYFPRIVAGFVVGFIVAGGAATPLQRWLDGAEQLLLVAAIAAGIMLSLLLATNARYHPVLVRTGDGGPPRKPPSLPKVLAKRFVLLIFTYQMLSAMVTQLLEFMVMVAAGERFTGSEALASFYGVFSMVLNLTDLLFLALVAGILLSRFGLKFGLTFNPGGVLVLLIAIVASGTVAGPLTPLFFGLVLLIRVADMTFNDAATRGSINAAYQALPAHERVTVQAGVEGVGVPLALGLVGIILLLFNAMGGMNLVQVAGLALLLTVFWIGAALLVYRSYAANLLKTMRRRALGEAELTLDDAGLGVIEQLAGSDELRDVRLALDMLQGAGHPALDDALLRLVHAGPDEIQVEALTRIEQIGLQAALPAVQALAAGDADARVQGAAIRALCALEESDAVGRVAPALDSSADEVRLAAAVGLLRYGSVPGILAAATHLQAWTESADPDDRRFLARVIGETALPQLYQPLAPLLADPDPSVRRAALAAAGSVRHPRLLPSIVPMLANRATRSAASDALVAYGDRMVPVVEQALTGGDLSPEETARLVRACLPVKGDAVQAVMARHLDHPNDGVREQIFAVLGACSFHAQGTTRAAVDEALRREAAAGYRTLQAQQELGDDDTVAPLQRALRDELAQIQQRIFWLLSFLYESRPILRAGTQLEQGSRGAHALALEMLDVTLSAEHKALIFPLLERKLGQAQRVRLLDQQIALEVMAPDARITALAAGGNPGWLRACALYSAAQRRSADIAPLAESALADPDPVVRETAAWCLSVIRPAA